MTTLPVLPAGFLGQYRWRFGKSVNGYQVLSLDKLTIGWFGRQKWVNVGTRHTGGNVEFAAEKIIEEYTEKQGAIVGVMPARTIYDIEDDNEG